MKTRLGGLDTGVRGAADATNMLAERDAIPPTGHCQRRGSRMSSALSPQKEVHGLRMSSALDLQQETPGPRRHLAPDADPPTWRQPVPPSDMAGGRHEWGGWGWDTAGQPERQTTPCGDASSHLRRPCSTPAEGRHPGYADLGSPSQAAEEGCQQI